MTKAPRKLIDGIPILTAVGMAALILTSCGKEEEVVIEETENVIKMEVAGFHYGGWPELLVHVNGEQIEAITVDFKTRKTLEIDVPNALGKVEIIELKTTSESNCHGNEWNTETFCQERQVTIRKVFLNDENLGIGTATGKGNKPFALQKPDGGITWKVGG